MSQDPERRWVLHLVPSVVDGCPPVIANVAGQMEVAVMEVLTRCPSTAAVKIVRGRIRQNLYFHGPEDHLQTLSALLRQQSIQEELQDCLITILSKEGAEVSVADYLLSKKPIARLWPT